MPLVLALLLAALALPPAAGAATRTAVDREAGVRLTLDGRELSVTPAPRLRSVTDEDGRLRLPADGLAVTASCGTSFRRGQLPPPGTWVRASVQWRVGEDRVRVTFDRDLSARAAWCGLQQTGERGGFASVSFVRAERPRRVAGGRSSDGAAWRLLVWRGDQREPCGRLAVGRFEYDMCFGDQSDRPVRLDFNDAVRRCTRDSFLFGVAPPSTRRVVVTLEDGPTIAARTMPTPRGSRVRARWFVVGEPRIRNAHSVEAFDARGRSLGAKRWPAAAWYGCRRLLS